MKRLILSLFILIIIPKIYAQTPDWQWAIPINTDGHEISRDIVADPATNSVYVVGEWANNLSSFFPAGTNPCEDFTAPFGLRDGYVAKYDQDGIFQWAFKLGGPGNDFIDEIVLDATGNIYITGYLGSGAGDAYFSGTSPLTAASTITNILFNDFYIVKYNSDGEFLWMQRSLTDADNIAGLDVAVNSTGVYATGHYETTFTIGSLSVSQTYGSLDLFIVKFDTDGNEEWIIAGGSNDDDYANAIVADENNIYVSGDFAGAQLDLKRLDGVTISSIPNTFIGWEDGLVFSYDSDGIFRWSKSISSNYRVFGYDIEQSNDSIYITGSAEGDVSFPSYPGNPVSSSLKKDIYLASLAKSNGNTGWAYLIPCTVNGDEEGNALAMTQSGEILLTGAFRGDLLFPGSVTLSALAGEDVFVAKYSPDGSFIWAQQAGSTQADKGYGISSGSGGAIYVSGSYDGTMTIGTLPQLPDANANNAFLAKLSEPCTDAIGGVLSTPTPNICIGDSSNLILATYSGDIRWQSSPEGLDVWTDIAGETLPDLVVKPSANTDYRAYLTSSPCNPDSSNIITIFVDQLPTINPGSGGMVCGPDFQFQAVLSNGTGSWAQYSGLGTSSFTPGVSSPDAEVNVSDYGVYEYIWTEINGTCSVDSIISVSFFELPTPNPGTGGDECDLDFQLQASPSVGSGTWTMTSGTGSASFAPNANDPNALATLTAYGTKEFTWTEMNGTCSDDSTISVTFFEQPLINAGPGGDACDLSFQLNAVPSVGIGSWAKETGPGTAVFSPSINDPDATVTVSQYGSYQITWKEINGPCSPAMTITVNFIEQPFANAGMGGDVCDFVFDLAATPSVGSASWVKSSGPGIASFSPSDLIPATEVTVSQYGAYGFTWTESNLGCSDDSTVVVNFYQQPIADPGTGGDECDLDFQLQASPSVGSGTWTMTSGTGSASFAPTANDPNALATLTAYGTKEFTWTEMNGTCSDDSTISVTFFEQPLINAGPGGDACDLSFQLNAVPSVGIGSWAKETGPGTAVFSPSINDPDATVTVSQYGSYQITWKEINGPCSPAMTITVNFIEQPFANAGMGGDVCDFVFDLAATPSVGSASWVKSSGPGIASFSPSDLIPATEVTVSQYGAYGFTWTESNLGCSDDSTVVVNFYQQPIADPGTGGDECDLDFQLQASPSVGSGTWTMTSGTGSASFAPTANDPNALATLTAYGTKEFTWTEMNGTCLDANAISVQFYEQPLANAGLGGESCGQTYQLRALPSIGAGSWSQTSGPGLATFLSGPTSPVTEVGVDEYGSYQFTWTEKNGPCIDASTIDVDFIETQILPISPVFDVCGLSSDITVSSDIGAGVWTKTGGPGDANFSLANSIALNSVTVSEYGTYEFSWTAMDGPCPNIATQVIIFLETPESYAGPDDELCELSYTLAAVKSIGIGNWEVIGDNNGITFNPSSNDPNAIVSVPSEGTYLFKWTEITANCSDSSFVRVNFHSMPEAYAGPDQLLDFVFSSSLDADPPEFGQGSWSVLSGEGIIENTISHNTIVNNLSLGDNEFLWTIKTVGCEDVLDQVIIIVNDLETPTLITPNNDGINDRLQFNGIDQMNNTEILIYNRWGGEVYRSRDYKNDWEGKDHKNRELIQDTYYYILSFPNGRIIKGFVEIRR